jgi:hypothetical protein
MTGSPPARPACPVRNAPRNGSAPATPAGPPVPDPAGPVCPVCQGPLSGTRARYCSPACRQRAFRLRHPSPASVPPAPLTDVIAGLRRQRLLAAHTVYECPQCNERWLGEQRCPECHLFCRALGVGGTCPDCGAVILLADLIGEEVLALHP